MANTTRITPGNRKRLSIGKMVAIYDPQSGEVVAHVRWRPCGQVFLEHAKHLKLAVVLDTPMQNVPNNA